MRKKDVVTTGAGTKASAIRPFRCGECLHFKAKPHSDKGNICSKEGIRALALAPTCFTPDVTRIVQDSSQLVTLITMLQGFDTAQRRILLAMLNSKPKRKVKFGLKVYFLAMGGDYLSNYLSGFIVGTTSKGEIMVMGDPDKRRRGQAYVAYFKDMEDLFTETQFRAKRRSLKKKDRLEDPDSPFKKIIKTEITVDHEPPTLDNAPKEVVEQKKVRRRRIRAVDEQLKSFVVS